MKFFDKVYAGSLDDDFANKNDSRLMSLSVSAKQSDLNHFIGDTVWHLDAIRPPNASDN